MRPSQILATVSRQTLFPLLEKEGGGCESQSGQRDTQSHVLYTVESNVIHVEHARQHNSMHHNARCIVHTPCMCSMIHRYVCVSK